MPQQWSKADRVGLSRYIIDNTLSQLSLSIPNRESLIQTPEGREEIVRAIYEALLPKELNYALEKYHPEQATQLIRLPSEIFNPPKEGTCLDLSLLFCSLCWEADLLPLLIILEGHALAAVSLCHSKRQWDQLSPERTYVKKGDLLNTKADLEKIREWVKNRKYLAIECTGFAKAQNFAHSSEPEAQNRNSQGYMYFEKAVEAGQQQLHSQTRSFEYGIDLAIAHYDWKMKPILSERTIDEPSSKDNLSNSGAVSDSRLQALKQEKERIEAQIAELNRLKNLCFQDWKSETNAARRHQLDTQIENYSQEIKEKYDKLEEIQAEINKIGLI